MPHACTCEISHEHEQLAAARTKQRVAEKRARARKRTLKRTVVASGCAFLATLAGLSVQMASGKDPVLGPQARQVELAKHPRIAKRIIKRKIIVRKIQPAPQVTASSGSSAATGSGYSTPSYSAPSSSYSAPAPAPAPAPVSSGAS